MASFASTFASGKRGIYEKENKIQIQGQQKEIQKKPERDSSVLDHVDKLNAVIRETMSFNLICGLNAAFASDPRAIHALLLNRVPCNTALANHPFIEVEKTTVLRGDENYSVSMVGMINGLLSSMNLPPVGVVWQKLNQNDPDSTSVIVGFAALPSDLQAESETDK